MIGLTTRTAGGAEVCRVGEDRAVTTAWVDPAEPVFAGHFPSFAIFPGVCLIECADQAARAALPASPAVLVGVDSARFLAPVFPGDQLITDATVRPAGDGGWLCSVRLTVVRGSGQGRAGTDLAAVIKLSYRRAEP